MSASALRVMIGAAFLVSAVVLASIAFAGGDEDELHFRYRAHSDKVTRGAGDAAASNIATQTIDPWPRGSERTRIDHDGKRAYIAIKRYETNTSIQPKGVNSVNGNGYNGNGYVAPSGPATQN